MEILFLNILSYHFNTSWITLSFFRGGLGSQGDDTIRTRPSQTHLKTSGALGDERSQFYQHFTNHLDHFHLGGLIHTHQNYIHISAWPPC